MNYLTRGGASPSPARPGLCHPPRAAMTPASDARSEARENAGDGGRDRGADPEARPRAVGARGPAGGLRPAALARRRAPGAGGARARRRDAGRGRGVFVCRADDPLGHALATMDRIEVDQLAVLDDAGRVVGVIGRDEDGDALRRLVPAFYS